VKKTAYLSDRFAVQYRNRKHLLNTTCHSEDYEYQHRHFFVKSHGKSVCDGVGGPLKRLATKKRMQ
jgi:hypothetical protein